jgi:hypothetical protein
MNRLAREVPLSKEQQIELAVAAQAGNIKAAQQLVETNLRLIIKFSTYYRNVAKHHHKTVEMDEFVSVGCVGLIKSLQSFDPSKGASVMWHAQAFIKGHMAALISQDDLLRLDLIRKRNKKARADGRDVISEPSTVYIDDTPNNRVDAPKPELVAVEVDPEQDRRLDVGKALSCLNQTENALVTRFFGLDGRDPQPSYKVKVSSTFTGAMKKMGYAVGAMTKPVPLKTDNPNRQTKSNREKGRRINGVLSCQSMTKPDSVNETHMED